jgi:Tol biopolymer transport system component
MKHHEANIEREQKGSEKLVRTSTSLCGFVLLMLGSMAGCDRGPTEPIASQVTIVGGDNQAVTAGLWLPMPLAVRVADSDDNGLPNVRVYWQLMSGAGGLASSIQAQPAIQSVTTTDGDGVARVFAQLTVPGTSTVAASIIEPRSPGVIFTATVIKAADAPEPSRPPDGPAPTRDEYINLANADGSGVARLVRGGGPAWSPDGRRIAFHAADGIHVINADGSNDVWLTKGIQPAWSPDGTRIVFAGSEGISVMNADGSAVKTLVRHDFREDTYKPYDMGVGQPTWSPDGARIAFTHNGDGDTQPAQIFVMDSDGSNRRLLTPTINGSRYAEGDPSWSPNGSTIVYWSYGYGLALINSDGGFPTTVYSEFSAIAVEPAWSPDGSSIAFTRRQGSSAPAIWTVSPNGTGTKVLISDGYDAGWSPDGARIAFVSTRSR